VPAPRTPIYAGETRGLRTFVTAHSIKMICAVHQFDPLDRSGMGQMGLLSGSHRAVPAENTASTLRKLASLHKPTLTQLLIR
jgi:hypothetical protein